MIDFIKWSYGRYEFGFAGGALFKDWLITPVLSSIPYLHLTGSKDPGIVLFFSGSFFLRLLEAFAFAVFGYFLFRYCRNRGIVMIAISLTLVIFSLPDHAYAIWKVATALQPLFVIVVASVLWSRLKVSQFAVWMRLYLTINILGFSLLLANYFDYAQPANAGQMPFVINQPIHQNYVFVTPSQSRIYLQIGYVRPLTWANGGYRGPNWEPNFNYLTSNELRLVAYFDCDAEGLQRCERIKRFSSELVERTFTEIDIELSEIIDSNGIVDRQKLNRAVEEIFGVKPLGNFNPRDPAFKLKCAVSISAILLIFMNEIAHHRQATMRENFSGYLFMVALFERHWTESAPLHSFRSQTFSGCATGIHSLYLIYFLSNLNLMSVFLLRQEKRETAKNAPASK